jgi:hypothetical protein
MNQKNPFELLNISENSTVDEIKKSFHKMIFLYHPDSSHSQNKDDGFTGELISAYKNALKIAEKKVIKNRKELSSHFFDFFGIDFFIPEDIDDYYFYCLILLGEIENIFYKVENFWFYKNLIYFLKENISSYKKKESVAIIEYFLDNLQILLDYREIAISNKLKDEYIFETQRKDFINYIKIVMESKDYLTLKYSISYPLEKLFRNTIVMAAKTKENVYKQEMSSIFFILGIFTEESFCDNIFKTLL